MSCIDILQVDPAALIGDEQLGSKSKFWFEHGDEKWLFKFARDRTGEHWAEKIAAEVAAVMGVEAARVELAEYRGRPGAASRSFVGPNESLVHGNEILAGQLVGYDIHKKLKQTDHTIENIVEAIRRLADGADWYHNVLEDFAWYWVLDALIANTDRHHENWGFIVWEGEGGQSPFRLAPSFDHASSLGREILSDNADKILNDPAGVDRYVKRGHGGIYWTSTDPRGANPLHLVELAAQRYPRYLRAPLQAVANTPIEKLTRIVDEVPLSVMTPPSRRLAKAILAYSHRFISGWAP